MSRCKACNEILKDSEIIWIEELGEHEELCSKCLTIVRKCGEEDDFFDVTTIIHVDEKDGEDD